MLRWMIAEGYAVMPALWKDEQSPWKNGSKIQAGMRADKDAEYAEVIEIDLSDIKEPIVCFCPNDPDDAKRLLKQPVLKSR